MNISVNVGCKQRKIYCLGKNILRTYPSFYLFFFKVSQHVSNIEVTELLSVTTSIYGQHRYLLGFAFFQK